MWIPRVMSSHETNRCERCSDKELRAFMGAVAGRPSPVPPLTRAGHLLSLFPTCWEEVPCAIIIKKAETSQGGQCAHLGARPFPRTCVGLCRQHDVVCAGTPHFADEGNVGLKWDPSTHPSSCECEPVHTVPDFQFFFPFPFFIPFLLGREKLRHSLATDYRIRPLDNFPSIWLL